jgi:soluble epoxide hydrolase / lipid-phosphate phosphatase
MREMFCQMGAMREYVARQGKYKDFTVELKPYARDPELKRRFTERMKKDSFAAPVNYYHSLKDNHNLEDEKSFSEKDKKIDVPLLYIGQTGDWVCRTDLMIDAKEAGLTPDLEEKVAEAGHWCLYEIPDELSAMVIEWLQERFPVK